MGAFFAVTLQNTSLAQACHLAEKIRSAIADLETIYQHHSIYCTVSIGISTLGKQDEELLEIIKRADDALYIAKNNGRNRVITEEDNLSSLTCRDQTTL